MRTGAAVPAAEPSSATGGRGSNDAPREGVLRQLLPDILSGRTSRRLHCAQRLSAMPRKRQCIGSELPASISGKPRRRSALSQPHACKAKNGFSYVAYSRLESSIASKSSAPHKDQGQLGEKNFVQKVTIPATRWSGISLTYAPQSFSAWASPLKPARICQLSEIKQCRILARGRAGLAIAPVLGHTSAGHRGAHEAAPLSACTETWPRG